MVAFIQTWKEFVFFYPYNSDYHIDSLCSKSSCGGGVGSLDLVDACYDNAVLDQLS